MTESMERIVVVTGGSRGIGRAICTSLGTSGTTVYFADISDPETAEETVKAVAEAGGKAFFHQGTL